MPMFQRSLQALQPDAPGSNNVPATRAQIQEAAKIRKRLMDSFAKYNLAAVRLRDLKTESATQQRLQISVYSAASTFLHANMVPLKHVPKMLRSQQSSQGSSSTHRRLLANLNGGGSHMSPLRNGESVGDGADSASVAGSEEAPDATYFQLPFLALDSTHQAVKVVVHIGIRALRGKGHKAPEFEFNFPTAALESLLCLPCFGSTRPESADSCP
ncbi:carboxypeptidase Y-deficient [Sporothrix curviconia]|uniref:Carboxypeptidase Y-deficient n=1 Tax=Sporothrix curviconia TaxID=1260050 RepID=A0ABP0AY22_9PEZI